MQLFLQIDHRFQHGETLFNRFFREKFLSLMLFSPTLPSTIPIRNISEAFPYILNNNIFRINNQMLKENEEQILETMTLLRHYPDTMFSYLQEYFAKHFEINLLIIGFRHGKFSLIKKENNEKRYIAFLVFDERNAVYGVLYNIDANGTVQTVFNAEDCGLKLDVYLYIMHLNDPGRIVWK